MRTIMMLIGLPASGKSTFARSLLKKEPGRWKRVNKDDLRLMLDDSVFDVQKEEFIQQASEALIKEALRSEYDVVIDNTHLSGTARRKVHKLAEKWGDVCVLEKVFPVSVEECLKRNASRDRQVPEDVIREMAKKANVSKNGSLGTLKDKKTYYAPHCVKGELIVAEQDRSLPKAIICDLDGTLALLNGRNPYDASTADKDLPNTPVIECVKAMYKHGYRIIFMSGREDKHRKPTVSFLFNHMKVSVDPDSGCAYMFNPSPISYELYMRPTGDMRKDSIVKRELFERHVRGKYCVEFVLDDRQQVVDMWRKELQLPCLQVAPGDF